MAKIRVFRLVWAGCKQNKACAASCVALRRVSSHSLLVQTLFDLGSRCVKRTQPNTRGPDNPLHPPASALFTHLETKKPNRHQVSTFVRIVLTNTRNRRTATCHNQFILVQRVKYDYDTCQVCWHCEFTRLTRVGFVFLGVDMQLHALNMGGGAAEYR